MKVLVLIVALVGAACFGLASADAAVLKGPALKNLISGKRVYIQTPFGGEFPLHYRPNGEVSGDGTALGLGRFMAPTETGHWWVKGPNLCQKWPTWYHGRTTCFTIERTGSGEVRWVHDDGKIGKARIGP